jgi:hypothetical protein
MIMGWSPATTVRTDGRGRYRDLPLVWAYRQMPDRAMIGGRNLIEGNRLSSAFADTPGRTRVDNFPERRLRLTGLDTAYALAQYFLC